MTVPSVGIYVPQVDISFDALLERAQTCERLGIDSFWLYDHLYTPGLPDHAALEGWTLATALLARTSTLRVGHLVLDNNLRHPALLAKMATTLDVISGGRLEFGIGSGSVAQEHAEGGFPWGSAADRAARLAETLEVVTRMWSGERASFEGDHYQVRDLPNLPPAVQQPHPPIHLGGIGERWTIPLVARYADVWNIPTYGLGVWRERIPTLERACAAVGRDPASIRRSVEAVLVVAEDDESLADARRRAERRYAGAGWGLAEGGFVGTPAQVADRMGELAADGVSLFVFFPADRGAGDMVYVLAEQVLPQLR